MGKQTSERGEEQHRSRARAAAKTVGGRGGGGKTTSACRPRRPPPGRRRRSRGNTRGNVKGGRPGGKRRKARGREHGKGEGAGVGGHTQRRRRQQTRRPAQVPAEATVQTKERRGWRAATAGGGAAVSEEGEGEKRRRQGGGGRREHSGGVTTLDRGRRGRRRVNWRGAERVAWVSQKRSVRNGASASVGKRVRERGDKRRGWWVRRARPRPLRARRRSRAGPRRRVSSRLLAGKRRWSAIAASRPLVDGVVVVRPSTGYNAYSVLWNKLEVVS